MPTWFVKTNLQLALLAGLRTVLAPTIAIGTLIACTALLDVRFTQPYLFLSIIAALLCTSLIGNEQRRNDELFHSGARLAGRLCCAWLAITGILLLMGYATKTSEAFSRRALFLWFVATPALLVAGDLLLRYCLRMTLVSSRNVRTAVIAGANQMSLSLARILDTRPELGLRVTRLFDDGDLSGACNESDGDGRDKLENLRDYVQEHRTDVVFIARPAETPETRRLLNDLRDTTCSVYLIPDLSLFDLIQARTDDIHGVPVIAVCESPFHGARGVAKRLTDIAFSLVLLLLAAPLMIGIAIAIRHTSNGPAIFRQHRYGLDGERITIYKFRTMSVAENGSCIVQATKDDPRVTPLGRVLRRTSLDELPQLLNVLQGRMSLVGPRPHAVAHNEAYRKQISGYMVRHKVTPGMTGLAQVNGLRGETRTVEEMRQRVKYDIEYMRQWCWLLDIKILFKTCRIVFKDVHAH
jgi:putative colanic acid biosynthesis UDP-glucose lipid carrier transferase